MTATPGPQFFLAGVQKSGTTSLWQYLRQHPGLFLPEPKEPHFWCGPGDGTPPAWQGAGDRRLLRQLTWDPDRYRAIYEPAGERLAGDCSTMYFVTPGVERRISAAIPDARVILLLRDPTMRAHSGWRMWRSAGFEDRSFAGALAAEDERLAAGWSPAYAYRGNGCYAHHLERWLGVLSREQILVLRTDDLAARPLATVQQAFAFLGVDPSFTPDVGERHNARDGTSRSVKVDRLMRQQSRAKSVVLRVVPQQVRQPIGRRVRAANVDRRPPEESTVAELRRAYAPELDRLEELLGWDLSAWRTRS